MAKFCPLFSSSKGNSVFIGSEGENILIDAGVCNKNLEEALRRIKIDADSVKNIFITHEHIDHIKGLNVFTKKHKVRLFMTDGTYKALNEKKCLDYAQDCVIMQENGVELGCMRIKAFETSHDSNESCCYSVELSNGRKISVVTDLGVVTPQVMESITGSDLVMLESNHDVNMLQCGPYPYMLKRRILGVKGHLSNDSCADALKELVKSGTTRIFLGHLSEENNVPKLAYQTAVSALSEIGACEERDYYIRVAKPVWDERPMIL